MAATSGMATSAPADAKPPVAVSCGPPWQIQTERVGERRPLGEIGSGFESYRPSTNSVSSG